MRLHVRVIVFMAVLLFVAPLSVFAQEDITDTYVSDDGTYTFGVPEDWFVGEPEDFGGIALLIDNDEEPTVVAFVYGPETASGILGIADGDSPDEAVETAAEFFDGEVDNLEEVELDNRDAAYAEFSSDSFEGYVMAIQIGDEQMGVIVASVLDGAARDTDETLLAVLETLDTTGEEPTPPEFEFEVFASDDESYGFAFPVDWIVEEDEDVGLAFVSDNEDALGSTLPSRGFLLVIVISPNTVANVSSARDEADVLTDVLDVLEYEYDDPFEIEVGSRTMIASDLDFGDNVGRAFLVPFDNGDMGILVAIAPEDEFEDYEAELTLLLTTFDTEALEPESGGGGTSGGGGGDDGETCDITPAGNAAVNVRSGPGTNFAVEGSIEPGDTVTAVGFTDTGSAIWFELEAGGFVRSDLVTEETDCSDLPEVDA